MNTFPRIGCRLFIAVSLIVLVACSSNPVKTSAPGNPGQLVAQWAAKQIGKPYRYGGNSPQGFDCSGLVQYSYAKAGIRVPRTTREQLHLAKRIKLSGLQAGDVIFFRLDRRKVAHVGIYLGNQRMVHAPSSGQRVSYARLDRGYWRQHITAIGRLY